MRVGRPSEDFVKLRDTLMRAMQQDVQRYLDSNEPVPAALLRECRQMLADNDVRDEGTGIEADPITNEMPEYENFDDD